MCDDADHAEIEFEMLALQSMNSQLSHKNDRIGVLILAGGNSTRMGSPKPWLAFDEASTFLQRIIHIYKVSGIEDVVVVLNADACSKQWTQQLASVSEDCRLIKNHCSEKGRLYSIRLGMKEVRTEYAFIHNVDSPYIEVDTLSMISRNHLPNGVTIPRFSGKNGHPILVSKEVKSWLLREHDKFETLKHALSKFEHRYVMVNDKHILANVNTIDDYERLKREHL